MQSAQPRQFDDVAVVGWFDGARVWRVLIQCPVSSVSVIVVEIAIQTPAEVMFAEHNDVVQALAPDGSNQAFDHRILPGRLRGNHLLFQSQALDAAHEIGAIDAIPVPKQITRWSSKRKGFDHFLGGPGGGGSLGDVEVKHFAPLMGQDQEDIKHPKCGRRDGEEIDCDQLFSVVVEERLPRLS